MAQHTQHRYAVLDGLRGLAAIIIVQRHANWWPIGWHFGSGYLAVDFFFMLSGFVMAHAYGERLRSGLSTTRFMWLRLLRLYPLYFIALIGTTFFLTVYYQDLPPWSVLLGLVLLPNLATLQGRWLVVVSWSLAAELLANLAYGATARRLTPPILLGLIALSGSALVAAAATFGSLDGGWQVDTIWIGMARIGFCFSVGLAIHQFLPRLRAISAPWPVCAAALAILLSAAPAGGLPRVCTDLSLVIVAMPLLLIVGANSKAGQFSAPLLLWLGEASYALYILQEPMRQLADTVAAVAGIHRTEPLFTLAAMAAMLGAATLATRCLDAPLRAFASGTPAPPSPLRGQTAHLNT